MTKIMNNPEKVAFRKALRTWGTSAEATLWKAIKGKQVDGLRFRRQQGVGAYVLDFYCPQLRLAIELDGEVHMNAHSEEYDERRSQYLAREADIQVLRFENRVVFENLPAIINEIRRVAKEKGVLCSGEGKDINRSLVTLPSVTS
jgi:very-short-patch-repair endonuclease